MIDPYRMIVINFIASFSLLFGILIYKFIYPRGKFNFLFILILISLLPLISMLRKGTYESGDLSIHVGFATSFYESLMDGNFIPRWSSQIIYGYGYPLFIFVYPLPYYMASLLHFLGFTFINSFKLILAFSFIASGIGMYLFIKEELKNRFSAFFAALIYLFAPYHLVDTHYRVSIGEALAFAILPFCFLIIRRMSNKIAFLWFFLTSSSIALLVLSHQAISLTSFPFLIAYCLYLWITKNKKKFKNLFAYIFSLVIGLLLSSFYWIPVIFESKYINLLNKGVISFIQPFQLLYSPWRWGLLFQGPSGELSFIVGYVQWFVIILSVVLFLKGKNAFKEKKLYLMSVISFFILLFLTQSISKPLWMNIPLLKGFQFSYRLLLLVAFFVSIISGIVIKNIKNKWFFIVLCFIAISTTILNWGNRKTLPQLNDAVIQYEFPSSMTKVGDSTTIWVDSNKFTSEKRLVQHITVIQGEAKISDILRNSARHKYLINVRSDKADFKENTLYFPNWVVKVNNKPYPFRFTDRAYPGVITFSLNKGSHIVEIIFMNTFVRNFSMLLSALTFLAILIYFFVPKKLNLPKF